MIAITECTPPSPDRGADSTQYLPIVEDGRIDTTIYQVDAKLDELNKATFNFAPESIRSMHEGTDGNGCTEVSPAPVLDISALATFITELSDAVKETDTSFVGASGEQMIARAYDVRYGLSGTSLREMAQALTALLPLVETVSTATDEHTKTAYAALRTAITKCRAILAAAVEAAVENSSGLFETAAIAGMSSALPIVGVPIGAAVAGTGLFNFFSGSDVTFPEEARKDATEALNSAVSTVEASQQTLTDSISSLLTAIDEVPTPIPGAFDVSTSGTQTLADTVPAAPEPLSTVGDTGVTGGSGGGAPLGDTSEPLEEPSLEDQLADLMGSDPMAGMPTDTGMGSGGGLPSSGGMPSDMGSGMSSPLSDALGSEELAKPLEDLAGDDEEELEEPLDDLSEDEEEDTEEPLEDPGEIGEDGELPEAEDPTEGDEDGEGDTEGEELPEDGEAPVEPEAEVDPNSEEARTADVGNGRKVLFPDANLAKLAEGMATPGAENKTLRLIASELGFQIPPDGQDIGKQVPTSLLREGDVIVGTAGEGIFIGTDEVLMEGGKIVPLSEAAVFDGQNQGIFRLDEGGGMGGDTTPAPPSTETLTGVAQPVGDGSTSPVGGTDPAVDATPTVSTPGDATAQEGTPGVPDDADASGLSSTDDTAAGAAFGETDNGAGGLNPDDVFPSN